MFWPFMIQIVFKLQFYCITQTFMLNSIIIFILLFCLFVSKIKNRTIRGYEQRKRGTIKILIFSIHINIEKNLQNY